MNDYVHVYSTVQEAAALSSMLLLRVQRVQCMLIPVVDLRYAPHQCWLNNVVAIFELQCNVVRKLQRCIIAAHNLTAVW